MNCPECGSDQFIVKDSHKTCEDVIRIRKCKECGHESYTIEEEVEDEESIQYAKQIITEQSYEYQKKSALKRKGSSVK